MKNTILKFGLLSGLVSAILMSASAIYFHRSGQMEGGEIIGYTGMIISMVVVFIGVKTYRDKERSGQISFGEAFKVGGLMALISCICYVLAWMMLSEWVMPDFMDQYIAHSLEKMRLDQKPEAEIQKAAAEMEQYRAMYANPLLKMAVTFIEPLPVALLGALTSALLLKKKQDR